MIIGKKRFLRALKLELLARQIEALTNDTPCDNHVSADQILLETIDALTPVSSQAVVTRITEAYSKIEKWYA